MIVAVDMDGTLVDSQFPRIGEPVPGAFEWLKKFKEAGATLILLTMRSDNRADGTHPLKEAVEFCRRQGVEFAWHNTNPQQETWTSSRKVYAHVYIDDANACCPLAEYIGFAGPVVDWQRVGPLVLGKIVAHRKRLAGD